MAESENNQEVQSYPSYNPADLTTTAGMLDYIYRCNSMMTENCMPAIVEEYNREKNVVTVKPCINITAATGETIEREKITATVMSICGGKFIINFPLEKGDTGWLITADRDISLFREQRKVINANTNRIHSIEDSFFIPDRVNDFKVEAEDEKNLVIQNLDRNIRISLGTDKIKITTKTKPKEKADGKGDQASSKDGISANDAEEANRSEKATDSQEQSDQTTISIAEKLIEVETTGRVTVKAKKNVSCVVDEGDIECKCKNLTATVEKDTRCACENLTAEVKSSANVKARTINLEGNVNIKGNLNIDGNTDCSGDITGSAVKAGSIDLAGHVHGGVETGSGTTGGAQ